jgi:hypothetical protein
MSARILVKARVLPIETWRFLKQWHVTVVDPVSPQLLEGHDVEMHIGA